MTKQSFFKQSFMRVFSLALILLSSNLMADLILSEGGGSGTWFNPTRSGEGFYVEIIELADGGNAVSIAMYSFDGSGNQLWLVGTGGVGPSDVSAEIALFQYDGPKWGPDFDSSDLNEIPFGAAFVRFPTCDTALFAIDSDGVLESNDYSLNRLTTIEGVGCTEPPDAPTGLASGGWVGAGVCFNVNEEGTHIIGGNLSACDAQATFDSNLEGVSNEARECNVTASCEGTWPIVDGEFYCVNELGEMAIGTFTSTTSATGKAFEGEGGKGEYCTANWTAAPLQ